MAATGTYISRSDLEDIAGEENVHKWANLNRDAQKIEDRIQRGINYAEELVESRFRGGKYAVPFVQIGTCSLLIDWCARLAVAWLYKNRGFDDTGSEAETENTRMESMRENVMAEIDAALSAQWKLDLQEIHTDSAEAPFVVNASAGNALSIERDRSGPS